MNANFRKSVVLNYNIFLMQSLILIVKILRMQRRDQSAIDRLSSRINQQLNQWYSYSSLTFPKITDAKIETLH